MRRVINMPEKQPDIWAAIAANMYNYFLKHDTMLCVAIGTAVVTIGKLLSDGKRDTFWGVLTEALIAAFTIGAAFELIDNLGYEEEYIYAVGVLLCTFGTKFIRSYLVGWLKNKGFLKDDE